MSLRAIQLSALKEVLKRFLRIALDAVARAKRLFGTIVARHIVLLEQLLKLPGLVGKALRKLLSSKPVRFVTLVAASIVCISVQLQRYSGANVQLSSSLSLLFGMIKVQGTVNFQLGRPQCDHLADAAGHGEELRISCPQDLKEHIVRFLEAQAARSPELAPAWHLSPAARLPGPPAASGSATPRPEPVAAGAGPPQTPSYPPAPATAGAEGEVPVGSSVAVDGGSGRAAAPLGGAAWGSVAVADAAAAAPAPVAAVASAGLLSTHAACTDPVAPSEGAAPGLHEVSLDARGILAAAPAAPERPPAAAPETTSLLRGLEALLPSTPQPLGAVQPDGPGSSRLLGAGGGQAAAPSGAASDQPGRRDAAGDAVPPSLAAERFWSRGPVLGALGSAASQQHRQHPEQPQHRDLQQLQEQHPLVVSPGSARFLSSLGPVANAEPPALDYPALMSYVATYRSPSGAVTTSHDSPLTQGSVAATHIAAATAATGNSASGASRAAAAAGGTVRRSPDSILGLRGVGLEGWTEGTRAWERMHLEED